MNLVEHMPFMDLGLAQWLGVLEVSDNLSLLFKLR
jgi:hypothetical protein